MVEGGHGIRLAAQLVRQIATKAASEQSSPKRAKRPRKLGEVTKRTSAGMAVGSPAPNANGRQWNRVSLCLISIRSS
jgi:hypothetical protein